MDCEGYDLRESKEFKAFTRDVLEFIRQERAVTWRRLAERFTNIEQSHYWITLAVESLEVEHVTVEREKIPEIIRIKEKKIMQKSKLTEENIEQCAAYGLSRAQAAERIGVSESTINTAFSRKPELKAAWNRGLSRRDVTALTKPKEEPAPKAEIVPSKTKIELVEDAPASTELSALPPAVRDLFRKVRAEFIYQEAWNEPSPRRGELVQIIEQVAQ